MARISFESYKKKLRVFAQYKNMSDEFFEKKAKALYDKKFGAYQPKMEIIDNEVGSWLSQDEADKAQELYNGYLKGRNITNFSDLVLLKTLVNYDIQSMRIQRIINDHLKKSNDDAKGVFVPTKELNMLNEINEQILSLKKTLGLSDEKKTNDPLEYVNILKKKFKVWRENNQGTRTLTCIAKKSKILMSDFTTKNIEDININDEILGVVRIEKEGLKLVKQKVKNKICNGEKRVLNLKTNTGRELKCTPDHLIFAHLRAKNKKASGQGYFPSENCLRRELKVLNGIDDLEEYYKGVLIGLIESDGWSYKPKDKNNPNWDFSKHFYICQSPKNETLVIEFVLDFLNIEYKKVFRKPRPKYEWGDGVFNYSININKTDYINNIREEIYKTKDRLFGFLAGFILGDGHIDKWGNAYITQKNKTKLVIDICNKLELKIVGCKNLFGNNIECFSLRKQVPLIFPNSKKTKKFIDRLFNSGNHHITEEIISLELLKEQIEVYDLTTETGNFIANGFIVHNCPHCSKMVMLKIRTEAYEAMKHPFFFKDRILSNAHLWDMYKENKITLLDVCKVLLGKECDSTAYGSWLERKIFNVKEKNLVDQEEIKESGSI